MKPLEHRSQNQTDADAEPIGYLIELHCVLESGVALLQYYGTDRGNGIAMGLYVPDPPSNIRYLHPNLGEPGRVEQ